MVGRGPRCAAGVRSPKRAARHLASLRAANVIVQTAVPPPAPRCPWLPSTWRTATLRHALAVGLMATGLLSPVAARGTPTVKGTATAVRGAGAPLTWTARRFGPGDAVVTVGATALTVTALVVGPTETATSDPQLGIDDEVRSALRPDSFQARRAGRDTSDVLLSLNLSYPLLGDALVNAAWYRDSPDTARQLAMIDSETFLLTLGVQQSFANFVGRQRPHGSVCGTDELPENTASCEVRDRYRSFFSGHTALSFSAAAATCTHHRHLPLHGGRYRWIPCATGVVLASTTGTLRIVGDRHYFTDVMTGAAIGSLVGWLVPSLHYRLPPRAARWSDPGNTAELQILPTAHGLQLRGRF